MQVAKYILACAAVFLVPPCVLQAAEPPGAAQQCSSCHLLEQPAQPTLVSRSERAAPPLFYSGNKFRRAWLVSWLQDPRRLRPAGDFPPAHVHTVEGKDVIDASTLIEHPALAADDAEAVADWLMTLTPNQALIDAESGYTPGNVSPRMGAMDFVKFKGCGACHRDTPEYGGFSGPELYTAWERLQPEFIVSYIRNPTAWEPYSLMPNKALQDPQIHKLANYLKVISAQEE